MGKYKSYIFLGITVIILLLVGYCVAKNSKGKKEEKEIDKKEVVVEEVDNKEVPKTPANEIEVEPKPVNKTNQNNTQVNQQTPINETPKPKTVKQEVYDVKLEFRGNNYISWNPKLANSGATLTLVIERNGSQVDKFDVSGSSSYPYVPGADGDLKKTKVILKVEGVEFKGKTSFSTNEFTCSVH